VLPRRAAPAATDDELSDAQTATAHNQPSNHGYENEKLIQAFQSRYIRLRLHGTRLPRGYTVTLRLPRQNDRTKQPRAPAFKCRRTDPAKMALKTRKAPSSTDSGSDADAISPIMLSPKRQHRRKRHHDDQAQLESNEQKTNDATTAAAASEEENEDATIRANNAYTGATNSIGSIHQRNWYMSLDRANSGFVKRGGRWVRGGGDEDGNGTGRLSGEVLKDEGVEGFVGRGLWRGILK
jgi:hypothetical protein